MSSFQYEFDFETFLDNEEMPVASSIRVNVRRISHNYMVMETQSNGETFHVCVGLCVTGLGKTGVGVSVVKLGVGGDGKLSETGKGSVSRTLLEAEIAPDGTVTDMTLPMP